MTRDSCHALVLTFASYFTLFSGHYDTRTSRFTINLDSIHSFQRGISCHRYYRCIDKVLNVKWKPLWRIYDTSRLERADNEDLSSFHDTVVRSAYANVSVMTFSWMTEQFWG